MTVEFDALSRAPHLIRNIPSSYDLRPQCWHDISRDAWNSFSWQSQHRILDADTLAQVLPIGSDEREAIAKAKDVFPIAVSPHYAALIRTELGENCPIRRQALPSSAEFEAHCHLLSDPLGERRHAIASCAAQRYPDRALIYSTPECAMRCRHCTRRSRVGMLECVTDKALSEAIDAVEANTNIRDVLISGGDPLSLPNEALAKIIGRLRQCAHIDIIRLCTRMPCTQPQRFFDSELMKILHQFAPIYLNTQFNHPLEATAESEQAFAMLREAGCILGNQSVLLRSINDKADTLEPLFRWLLRNGCRPYYLFLCDAAQGTHHFRTSIQTGLDIMKHLRGRLSGLAIPHFVIDLPDGYGKVDLCPDSISEKTPDGQMTIVNWFGAHIRYQDEPM